MATRTRFENIGRMRPGGSRRPSPQNVAAAAAMAGAVDLAAVKARAEAAARAADAPPAAGPSDVVAVTEATLQTEVVDRSFQVPVLLVVTSARSPVGDQLLRDLETLARERAGNFVLGHVDMDVEMRIAQLLQVRVVPTMFVVIGGQTLPGPEGVLSMAELRQFVDAVLKAAAQQGVGSADGAVTDEDTGLEDPRFDAAEAALADGDYPLARRRFQEILDAEPGNAAAALALKQVGLLERIASTPQGSAAPAPDDVPGQLAAADLELAGGYVDRALERLLALLVRTSGEDRETVRVRLIDYLDLLGPDDPRVAPARRRMAQSLF